MLCNANTKQLLFISPALLVSLLISTASADLTNRGPFVGDYQESFEAFPNYHNGGNTDTLVIANGQAEFSSTPVNSDQLYVIDPPFANWFLGGNRGMAGANNGTKALGLFDTNGNFIDVALTFDQSVTDFGFYYLTADGSGSTEMIVSLFDENGNQLGSDQILDSGGNIYQWVGWQSSVGIKSVRFTGNEAPVLDDLQMIFIPEPSQIFFMLLATGVVLSVRRRGN